MRHAGRSLPTFPVAHGRQNNFVLMYCFHSVMLVTFGCEHVRVFFIMACEFIKEVHFSKVVAKSCEK